MIATPQQVHAGQAAFTPAMLSIYDRFVLDFTCRHIWRCPNERVLAWYAQHLSGNHLEVGVGTGYFLDHSRFPTPTPRLALLDLNPNCLLHTAKRLKRYVPWVHQASVLAPIRIDDPPFESIGLNYVLHCLPGTMAEKSVAFANLKALLKPGGVLFGATLLQGGVPRTRTARACMWLYNARGIFSNRGDDLAGLRRALKQHFKHVRIETEGCVALFSGRC